MQNFRYWLLLVVICGTIWIYLKHPDIFKRGTADLTRRWNDSQTAISGSVTGSDYQGTIETNFAKDWVIVDGVKLDGITRVNPAPGAQVAILYSGGGKDVPASKLPQGFLDIWQISPERLKAAGDQ